ncbi:MAG TPA: cupin domain-containing protein [Gemmatimonadaceae bacterium]|nr:cupin domain-containing protein [Gemmatimonadaceae bacterium]
MIRTSAGRRQRAFVIGVTLAGAAAAGAAVDRLALAQQPGIKRTILLRTDEPGSPTHEAVMGVAEIAPGAMAGKHRHPGIEIGYVLEGSVTLEHEGESPRVLKAGDSFNNGAGVHNARNTGKTPVKILAVYLVEKGKPIAEPVP